MQSTGISEEKRVSITQQLQNLRDSDASEIAFSSSLTTDERKFVHKISQEFGLKSKSQGVGENRFITVLKKKSNVQKASGMAPALWSPHKNTIQALSDPIFVTASQMQENLVIRSNSKRKTPNDSDIGMKNYTILLDSYEQAQKARQENKNFNSIQKKRSTLPAAHYRQAVCNLLKQHQIVLISGETGCGKSTQIPQFLLDEPSIGPTCCMAITQPRRISAVAVAERIASERSEEVGRTIGYNIRLDSARNASTQVLFMTPGVLLRKLLTDPLLLEYTHIVVDEAHERDRFTEFLQIILRDICSRRADLKLILMSATMHTDKIRAYFGDIPQINVGGSVFPVQEFYLEHVLRFTHFASDNHSGGGGSVGGVAHTKRATPVRSASSALLSQHQHQHQHDTAPMKLIVATPQFHCAVCGSGPFESPEELGTHSADCYPSDAKNKNKKTTPPAGLAPAKMSSLDALAASISALRMGGGGGSLSMPLPAPPALPLAPTDVVDNDETDAQVKEYDDDVHDDDDDEDDEEDNQKDGEGLIESDLGGRRARSGSEDDDAILASLLSQYQLNWDDSQVDCNLIYMLLKYVFSSAFVQQGSVLVFLPGWDDISRMHRILTSSTEFCNPNQFMILQLHSGIQKKEQEMVFHALKPGQHKIILSTNIAETSITIDDVAVVINTGRVKEKTYDPHTKLAYLQSAWISQASARQRRGRAGRTQAGVCFHLYSTLRSQHLSEFQDSELLRMPLEELVLQAKNLGAAPGEGDASDSVTSFLLKAMDPPHPLSVRNAISLLQAISCLDEHERVTNIGSVVSQLPLNPRMGRMILLGCLLGCGPSALATAAAMGYRDPFLMPATDQQRVLCNKAKSRLGGNVTSDQVVVLRALTSFTATLKRAGAAQARRFCDDNCLAFPTMQYLDELVSQLQQLMRDVNIQVNQTRCMRNDGNHSLLQAVVSTGLYPDVGVRKCGAKIFTSERGCKAKIHPSSVNARIPMYRKECLKPIESVGFQDLIASVSAPGGGHFIGSANLMMLSTTPLSMFSMLMACGRIEEVSSGEENEDLKSEDHVEVELDGWLSLQMHKNHIRLIRNARHLVAVALSGFLQGPHKQQDKTLVKGVDRLVEIFALEQQLCCSVH